MANWNTLQSRFIQGELSPYWIGQTDTELVREGAAEILNGVVTPQGPVVSRPGTTFLQEILPVGTVDLTTVRLWSFLGLDNEDYFAVFSENLVRIATWAGGVQTTSEGLASQIFLNTTFDQGPQHWSVISESYPYDSNSNHWDTNVDISSGVCRLESKPFYFLQTPGTVGPTVSVRQSRALPSDADYFTVKCNALLTADVDIDIPAVPPDHYSYALRVRVVTGGVAGGALIDELVPLEHLINKEIEFKALSPVTMPANASAVTARFEFVITAIAEGSDSFVTPVCTLDNITLTTASANPPAPVELTTVYSGEELDELHFVQSPFDNRELIILHPKHPPQMIFYDQGPGSWNYSIYPLDLATTPAEWTGDAWPSIGLGAQGRLWLTGLSSSPETIWASQVYDWKNFDLGVSLPNEALELVSIERDVNTWLALNKNILYGDRRRELSISSSGAAITASDVAVSVQTNFGCERMPQKISIGRSVVLPCGGNNDLRLCYYNRDDNGYIAPNIILKAEHLGLKKFRRIFYTRDPNQILWSIMQDGTALLCSFDDDLKMQAWSRLVTDGVIIDGCSVNDSSGANVVILAIQRFINGQSRINLEIVSSLRNISNWGTVDCFITQSVPTFATLPGLVDGFDDLEGKEVAVFLDGNFDGFQTVNNGQLSVDENVNSISCGIPFTFRVKTFPQPSLTSSVGITGKKRYSKLGVRGIFGRPPTINGQRPPDRSPRSIMNVPEPTEQLYDTDVVDGITDGFGVVTIEEPLPVRLTITGIYGKLTSNQL